MGWVSMSEDIIGRLEANLVSIHKEEEVAHFLPQTERYVAIKRVCDAALRELRESIARATDPGVELAANFRRTESELEKANSDKVLAESTLDKVIESKRRLESTLLDCQTKLNSDNGKIKILSEKANSKTRSYLEIKEPLCAEISELKSLARQQVSRIESLKQQNKYLENRLIAREKTLRELGDYRSNPAKFYDEYPTPRNR